MYRLVNIRKATESDRESFIELYLSCFKTAEEKLAKDLFEEKLSNPMTGFILLAEEDSKPVGIVTVDIIELTGHIVGLGVKEEWRKQGIGTALIKEAIESTTKMNRNIRHLVMTGKHNTIKIAKKFGFVQNDFMWVKYV